MIAIDLKPKAVKFIEILPPKHKRQIKNRILDLKNEPTPHDSKKLIGYEDYLRIDAGEYRVIYRYDIVDCLITVVLVGKRNDSSIYKIAKRTL